jgi:alcohol dehydrogenase
MGLVASGRLDPTVFATHHVALDDTMTAYDIFADATNTGALKVVLNGTESARNSEALVGATSAG